MCRPPSNVNTKTHSCLLTALYLNLTRGRWGTSHYQHHIELQTANHKTPTASPVSFTLLRPHPIDKVGTKFTHGFPLDFHVSRINILENLWPATDDAHCLQAIHSSTSIFLPHSHSMYKFPVLRLSLSSSSSA